MKYLYILLGLFGIGLGIFITYYWIGNGFTFALTHLFTPGQNYMARATVFLFVMFWLHGISYLWYGIKSKNINHWSTASIVILILMFVTVWISYSGVEPCRIGGTGCDEPLISDRVIYAFGLFLSGLVLLISFLKKPKLD
jgi:hypothetical protein